MVQYWWHSLFMSIYRYALLLQKLMHVFVCRLEFDPGELRDLHQVNG